MKKENLKLAYCYRIFLRCQTCHRNSVAFFNNIQKDDLKTLFRKSDIHLLDFNTNKKDIIFQVSLTPEDSVSIATSKLKGKFSSYFNSLYSSNDKQKLLARGYFCLSIGDTTGSAVMNYLTKQGKHHGYSLREKPPVYVKKFKIAFAQEKKLWASHNVSVINFHIVLVTKFRKEIFTPREAEKVTEAWKLLQNKYKFALLKVSFVPDHIHLAVRIHPTVKPVDILEILMNSAQDMMFEEFPDVMVKFSVKRLFEEGGYLGSFGSIDSKKVRELIRYWQEGVG